ncbi:retrovirus-related pol polyprotein from transposon TNT 1-94 [Tanacetum coccineum]
MLSGLVLSKQYWTEAIATVCYTQNRPTIVKRHLKTPYEIFHKRIPNINFLYVFGCPVYIHNHKDHLGKFDEKGDDGYLLGYSLISKAFRVFNNRIQQSEETYHITFNENPDAIKFSRFSRSLNTRPLQEYRIHQYKKTIPIPNTPLPIPLVVTPAPQKRWSQDKHIDLVNIIDFLSKEEPKKVFEALQHLGWVDAMQDDLNQFDRNKV